MKRDVGAQIRQGLSFFRNGSALIGKNGFFRLQGRNASVELGCPAVELFPMTGQLDMPLVSLALPLVGLALPLGQVVV